MRPMLLHSISNTPPLLNIRRNLLIRIDLRLDEIERFLGEVLGDANDAVDVANYDVAGVDYCVLVFAVETHWCVDLGSNQIMRFKRGKGETIELGWG